MAAKKTKPDPFLAERTRLLAQVVLTRRDDLKISYPPQNHTGLDLLVDIQDRESPGLRRFGVVLRGEEPPATEKQLGQILKAARKEIPHIEQNAIPVCLLYFTMQDNQGYFAWLVEPLLTEDDAPKLRASATAELLPLDKNCLDGIVRQVRAWYEALFAALKV